MEPGFPQPDIIIMSIQVFMNIGYLKYFRWILTLLEAFAKMKMKKIIPSKKDTWDNLELIIILATGKILLILRK